MKLRPTGFIAKRHALAVSLCLLSIGSGPFANAQLAATGTPGDRAVYTIGSGATLATGFGTSVVQPFATESVADTADSFDLQAGGAVQLTAGHHIVIYGTRYTNGTGARAALDTTVKINGATSPYGASASYSRDGTANNNYIRGGTILEVAQGDSIEIESQRTDNHSQTITQQNADLQLVKLDDALDYLRLGASADIPNLMDSNSAGPVEVSYDVQDELDAGFGHSSGGSAITLADPGHYLVFANTGVRISSGGNRHRQAITQRLTLDIGAGDQPVEDSATQVYLRFAGSTDGAGGLVEFGAASLGMIVETASADAVLKLWLERDNIPGSTNTAVALEAARTGLTILKLPGYGEYITLSGPAQDVNFPQADPETTFSLADSTPVANSAFAYDSGVSASQVQINKAGDYLFLASHYAGDIDGPTRTIVRQGFVATPSGGSAANVAWGHGGTYNRDQQAGGDRARDSGTWAGAVLPLGAGDTVETSGGQYGAGGASIADSVGLQALNIASISAAPQNPVVATNNGLALLIGETGTITAAELETLDANNSPDELEYIVLDTPAGGTLRLGGTALGLGSTFTQQDINDGLLTFAAGGVEAAGGFDFEVSDGGGDEASGTFAVNVGIVTALADDAGGTDEDTPLSSINGGDASLLDNDTGTNLSVISADASSAQGAAVTVNGDGTFTYDPTGAAALQALDDGDSVADTFSYTVVDFAGAAGLSTATVSVAGLNDPPVVVGEVAGVGDSGLLALNLLANDSDVDAGEQLTIASLEGNAPGTFITPMGATVTLLSDGSLTYNPCTSLIFTSLADGTSMTETLNYEVTDGTVSVSGTLVVTVYGEAGASDDVETVAAGGTVNVETLANDTAYDGAAGTPTDGAVIDLDAGAAGNSDDTWVNNGTGGGAVTLEGPGVESVLITPADAPAGVGGAYDLSGTGSGAQILSTDDADNLYGGNTSTLDATVELVFRPDAQTGDAQLWGSGGNGTGASIITLDNEVILTAGQNAVVAQARAALPADAVAGGDYVHVVGIIDLANDEVRLYINNALASTGAAIDITTGAPADITDWSGTDDEGIGRPAGTTGGDINVAPFLGAHGTRDIPDLNDTTDRFAGELAVLRVYSSALDPNGILANFEAIFGEALTPGVGELLTIAGAANPGVGGTVNLPSGAVVTVEADGSLTYDPNGAFDHVGVGLTEVDTFTYTLAGTPNATATVKVTVQGSNTDPQIEIAANTPSVTEGDPAAFTLSATAAVSGAVQVDLAYSGTASDGADFNGVATATLPGGSSSAPLSLTTIADALFEGTEDFTVTITGVTGNAVRGAATSASVTLLDSDAPPVFAVSAAAFATEGGPVSAAVNADVAATTDIDIALTFAGTAARHLDFIALDSVTLPAGETSVEIPLYACHDQVSDAGETIEVTVQSATLGGPGAAATDSVSLFDDAVTPLFAADFEGVTVAPPNGSNAPQAAAEGTSIGSWSNIPTATTTGGLPGVEPDGFDIKGDGIDHLLRVDRPSPANPTPPLAYTDVMANFASPLDFSGGNTGTITVDLGQIRTQGASTDKNSFLRGIDSAGRVSFELVIDSNNDAPAGQQLYHSDGLGGLTPLGVFNDFDNIQDNDGNGTDFEQTLTGLKIILTAGGYAVAQDIHPVDGVMDRVSGLLPYVDGSSASQVAALVFSLSTSTDDGDSSGLLIDDVGAVGNAGNVAPSLALGGAPLADGGSTAFDAIPAGGGLTFSPLAGTGLGVSDPDAGAAAITLRLQSLTGLGTITVTPAGGASIASGANGSGDLTLTGTVFGLNLTLANGVSYTAGAGGGTETLRLTADDGGNTGEGGALSTAHDFTFFISEGPLATIEQAPDQEDPTTGDFVRFTVTFSEAVTGFDGSDVDLTASTAPGALGADVIGGPTTYTVSVSGMTDCGEVIATVPAGAAFRQGTAVGNSASTSVDNAVTYVPNEPTLVQGGDQNVPFPAAATEVNLGPIRVSDGNNSAVSNTGDISATIDWLPGDSTNFNVGDPGDHSTGFSLDLEFTPAAADLAAGTTAHLYETGGTSNGHGIYLIDGIPYFLCKMNGGAGTVPAALDDPDWSGDNVVSIPLTAGPLQAGIPAAMAVIFDLDSVTYSADGAPAVTVPLLNRGTRDNWSGDDTVAIAGDFTAGGPGALSNIDGPYLDNPRPGFAGELHRLRFWRGSDADFSIKAVDEQITATLEILQPGSGTLAGGGGTFAGDTWSFTGGVAEVNAALAAVQFMPSAAVPDLVELELIVDDDDEDGSGPVFGEIALLCSVLQQWRIDNGLSADGSGPGEGNLDTAPNGRTLLENFAFGFGADGAGDGGDVIVAGATIVQHGGPTVVDLGGGNFVLRYPQRADASKARLVVLRQFSDDAALWEQVPAAVPTVIATGTSAGGIDIEVLEVPLPNALPTSGNPATLARLIISAN